MIKRVGDQLGSSPQTQKNSARRIQDLSPDRINRLPRDQALQIANRPQSFSVDSEEYILKPTERYWWLDSYCPVEKIPRKKILGLLPASTMQWLTRPVDKLLQNGTFQPEKMAKLRAREDLDLKDKDPQSVLQYLYEQGIENIKPVKIKFKDRTQLSTAKPQNHIKAIYIQSPIETGKKKVFVYCPGRSGGIGYMSEVALHQAYLEGDDILLLSYRGYDTNMMGYQPSQDSMADDIDAAINVLILEKKYKPEDINFTACSLGVDALINALALRVKRLAVVDAKEHWGKLDLHCPFKDLGAIARERVKKTIPLIGGLLQYPVWAAVRDKPISHHDNLDFVYPYVESMDFLANIEGEQGTSDELIPRWHTEANYQRARALVNRSKGIERDDRAVSLLHLPDANHQEVSTAVEGIGRLKR
ncbi:MAG: alpha/beta hydrolase [Cyanobacteria bacterium]|nr:alpha/beta hydrolase [Cyanobacteriota bacterium]